MDDGFSLPDALNENVGLIGVAAGSAGLRSLAGVRGEIESLKALLAKDADERRMQSFLREKLYQFRQQLDRIAKVESVMQRYVDALTLQEVFTEAAITSSMLDELGDKQYLAVLQDDLATATRSPEKEGVPADELVKGFILAKSLPLLLEVQDSAFALKQEISTLENDVAVAPAPMRLADALISGKPRLLQSSFLFSCLSILLVAMAIIVSLHLNKRVLSIEGSLDFGPAVIGGDTTRRVAVVNKGTRPLTVRGYRFPMGFREANYWKGVIPAGGSQDIEVVFSPTDDMQYGGALQIFSDATKIEELPLVSGYGSGSVVNIRVSTGRSSMVFPQTSVGSGGRGGAGSLIIDNIGETVYLFTVSCPEGFVLSTDWGDTSERLNFELAPGSSLQIFADFRPQQAGLYEGHIVVRPKVGEARLIPISAEAIYPPALKKSPEAQTSSLQD
jgi:hypothetical protein